MAAGSHMNQADVLVVGGGVVGLATAVAFAERGQRVLCLERGRVGGGQSAGDSRLFRHLHAEARLVDLAVAAREAWNGWRAPDGTPLLGADGQLLTLDDPSEAIARLERGGVEVELIDADVQRARHPAFVGAAMPAIFDPGAGMIRASDTIKMLARRLGDRLLTAEMLGATIAADGTVAVITPDGPYYAERLVIAAGAATQYLARGCGIDIPVRRHIHLRLTLDRLDPYTPMACWTDETGAFGTPVYGGPTPDGEHYALGLNGVDADQAVADGQLFVSSGSSFRGDVERLQQVARAALPGVRPDPVGSTFCVTTSLPDGGDHFGAWVDGPVTAIAGNNLFKFAPLFGGLVADAADGVISPWMPVTGPGAPEGPAAEPGPSAAR